MTVLTATTLISVPANAGGRRLGEVAFDGAYREIKVEQAASVHLTAVVELDIHATTSKGDTTARSL